MTKQEIQQAASEYAKPYIHLSQDERTCLKDDFIAGAQWAAQKLEKELVELTTMLNQIINASTDDQLDKAITNAQKRLKL